MIIDHIGLTVGNTERSKAFFSAALAPLGIGPVMEAGGWQGYGMPGRPQFWFGEGAWPHRPMHIAFVAPDRAAVRAFYDAAIHAGGTDNGPPGLRPIYHPNYYGAFVRCPDGHNIEAVCHAPEAG